ncbi:MAG: hypothetical protein JO141_21845 [Bradyrhizobium sp.]|nr:hypothetical protein [Bradyrhizobium sp.]
MVDAVASPVFVEAVVPVVSPVVGVDEPATALAVEAAVAIAAEAIVSGVPELPDVEAAAGLIMLTGAGGSAAIGTCAMVIVLTGVAVVLASVDWLPSLELLSGDELSLPFALLDFVLLPLLCKAELLLLLLVLFALPDEFPGSLLLLLLLAGELFTWFCWLWLAAEEVDEVVLFGVFWLGPAPSLAERCGGGGGGGGCCAGGSKFEASEEWLLSTIEAKLLASCEASGSAALSAALGGAL